MKRLLFVFSISMSSVAYTADLTLDPQTVIRVATAWEGNGIFLQFAEGLKYPGCTNPYFFIKQTNNQLFNQQVSIALSAFHAKSKLSLRVSGCQGNPALATDIVAIDLL